MYIQSKWYDLAHNQEKDNMGLHVQNGADLSGVHTLQSSMLFCFGPSICCVCNRSLHSTPTKGTVQRLGIGRRIAQNDVVPVSMLYETLFKQAVSLNVVGTNISFNLERFLLWRSAVQQRMVATRVCKYIVQALCYDLATRCALRDHNTLFSVGYTLQAASAAAAVCGRFFLFFVGLHPTTQQLLGMATL